MCRYDIIRRYTRKPERGGTTTTNSTSERSFLSQLVHSKILKMSTFYTPNTRLVGELDTC